MPAQKQATEFVPGKVRIKSHEAEHRKFNYSCIADNGDHIVVSVRRDYGSSGKIKATIYRGMEILEHDFERYELDFKNPYTGWSNQKRWLFSWAQYFVWKTDSIKEGETNEARVVELKAEIEQKQREVTALEKEDAQRYLDVPLPTFHRVAKVSK